jgi:flagellar biogenesis protein FliO
MQRFIFSRMLAWTLGSVLGLPLVCPPQSSGEQPTAVRAVSGADFSTGDRQHGDADAPVRFVAMADAGPVLRLPIALVPGRADRLTGSNARTGSDNAGLALAPRKASDRTGRAAVTKPERALLTTATSLAVVVGLFLLLVWLQRRLSGRNGLRLPGAVVQTLGRVPLNGRQEMHLVQVGNKLLLLAVTATSAETLTEITDPAEIARLNGICRHDHPGSISASFREILSQLQQPASSRPIR